MVNTTFPIFSIPSIIIWYKKYAVTRLQLKDKVKGNVLCKAKNGRCEPGTIKVYDFYLLPHLKVHGACGEVIHFIRLLFIVLLQAY